MRRRKLIAGLGAAVGGSTALGTGAFTSVDADRPVSVNVADEDQAYLALDELDGITYENATFASQNTKNQISIDIDDGNGTQDSSDGVGRDSIYEFDNVFQVKNQGTQKITVSIEELTDSDFNPNATGLTVQFYPDTSSESPLHNSPITLGTGDSRNIGLKVETDEPSLDDFSADATVSADAT